MRHRWDIPREDAIVGTDPVVGEHERDQQEAKAEDADAPGGKQAGQERPKRRR